MDPWKGPATIRGRSHPVNNKHLLNAKGVTERTKGRKKTYEEPQREGSTDRLDQTVLVRSGPFWSALVRSGPFWSVLCRSGLFCAVLVLSGLLWSVLVRSGPFWSVDPR